MASPPSSPQPPFAEAARFWAKLGFVSFGGPAGQIAILHREVVERRRWLDDREFTRALNFCMLLPGPEALQLAIFLGWKLHGIRGGVTAGLGFILPAVLLLFALSYVYVAHGSLPWVAALLYGLQAAVVALVLQALARIARRALQSSLHAVLAVASFVALEFARVPFPVVLLLAAAVGAFLARRAASNEVAAAGATPAHAAQTARVAAVGLALWLIPLLVVATTLGAASLWTAIYLFFTKAALVTFGGAYAVLGYVTSQLVDKLAWVTADQSVAGLALAETTPGPLIIVLQFMGFMAGWNQPGPFSPLGSALLAGALATWATFLPSFLFILLGAPYVERLTRNTRIEGALGAITAAVVGVIATLALLLAKVVLFADGWPAAPDWNAVLIALAAWFLLEHARWPLGSVLLAAAASGLFLRLLQQ
ncbi:MAG: chromate efflux transporter [Steroidobacteraceae bacterium]|jgi:chromate transporter|nr:chromate efflux transporter [Steroidobacteraceae bacterium]